ncbi:MAG: ubiquinone/menaquinone biosynthesis methyltransferase [Fibrobacterota bacterium]|nr:MAG: ubiquinone/menaquinone biosynthesis methyltransferase [Fibrobacterota bacterium]
MSDAIRQMFDRISGGYDTLNHVLSARRDLAWRRKAVSMLPKRQQRILDLCGGTGDFLLAARREGISMPESVVADFSAGMMAVLPAKGLPCGIQADALAMPFLDGTFDTVLCGFGMRNLDDLALGVREIRRVLKPGGTFSTLEFFRPSTVVSKSFYGGVAPIAIPFVGRVFGSSREDYEYLVRSIRRFASSKEYAQLLEREGFVDVRVKELDFGLCTAIAGRKV